MKKTILSLIFIMALMMISGAVFAKNNDTPKRPTENIIWHLSGAVMPAPPYGSQDITGSDTASKLTVKQPKNDKPLKIKGKMAGLLPNTTYTVYLSKSYIPYNFVGWNVSGNWIVSFEYQGQYYNHDMILTQTGNNITGNGGYPAGGSYTYPWTITTGSLAGNQIHLEMDYTAGVSCHMIMDGTIAPDATLTNGTWSDNCWGMQRSGTWSSVSGQATKIYTGDTSWPGLFSEAIPPFTFTTNEEGKGKWKIKLDGDYTGQTFSVWINNQNGLTILISDNVTIKAGNVKPPKNK